MALYTHPVRNDRLAEIVTSAAGLGAKPIPTTMTLPLSSIKRRGRQAKEDFDDAKQTLLDKYTVFQRNEDGTVKLDAQERPVPEPVYAINEDGTPRWKTDKDGNEVVPREREIRHGMIQLTDQIAYEREVRVLERQTTDLVVPHLSWPALEGRLKELEANIVEPLLDFFEGLPDESTPAPAPARRNGRRDVKDVKDAKEPAAAGNGR